MKHYDCIGLHQRECPEKVAETRFISVLAVNKCNIERGSVVISQRVNGSVKSPQLFGPYTAARFSSSRIDWVVIPE